jgi:hypothetical protein
MIWWSSTRIGKNVFRLIALKLEKYIKCNCLVKVSMLFLLSIIMNSCTSVEKFQVKKDTHYNIYRIKNVDYVDREFAWHPLRDTLGNLVFDSIKANDYEKLYSADSTGNHLFNKSLPTISDDIFKQKKASTEYFLGYKSLESKDCLIHPKLTGLFSST